MAELKGESSNLDSDATASPGEQPAPSERPWRVRQVMAEGVGFEPTRRFPAYTLSRRAPSTTRPPLRDFDLVAAHKNTVRRVIRFTSNP